MYFPVCIDRLTPLNALPVTQQIGYTTRLERENGAIRNNRNLWQKLKFDTSLFTPLTKLKNPGFLFFFDRFIFFVRFFVDNWRYSFVIFVFLFFRVPSLSEWYIIAICYLDPILDGGLYELRQIEFIYVCYSLK